MAQKKELVLGFSPWGNGASITPFDKVFPRSQNVAEKGLNGIDCLVLWGGTDWHPSYYKQKHHPANQAPNMPSDRDKFEWKAMLWCKAHDIPMIGVCRGAQGLCIFAGGKLLQHVNGHQVSHKITIPAEVLGGPADTYMLSNSEHHQMMWPWDVPHQLIGYATTWGSRIYEGEEAGKNVVDCWSKKEPEIVYFPGIRGLAIQGHPEWNGATKEFIDFCNDAVVAYLLEGCYQC